MADETYIDLNLKARPVEVDVAISDKSARQAENALSRLKKMADDMGSGNPMDRMLAQAQRLAEITKGDTRRYEQAQQQIAVINARIAESASRAHQQEQAAIESKVKALEREAAIKGKTGAARVEVQRAQFLSDGKFSPEQIARINAAFDQTARSAADAEKGTGGFMNSFLRMAGAVSLGNLVADTFMRMSGAVKDFLSESALYAARTQQLQYAQNAVARSNSISTAAVEAQVRSVQSLGITIQDARLGVSRMIAVNMDYAKSANLARVAQDLGRVAGISTAEAFERLVHATVTAQPELLRALGLNVSFEQSYAKFAQSIGTTADKLTTQQKAQVALNAVLQAGRGYMGAYEESQKTASGQMLSMSRYIADIKQALGEQFLPVLTPLIMKTVEFAKEMPSAIQKGADFINAVLGPIKVAAEGAATAIGLMNTAAKAIPGGNEFSFGLGGLQVENNATKAEKQGRDWWGSIARGAAVAAGEGRRMLKSALGRENFTPWGYQYDTNQMMRDSVGYQDIMGSPEARDAMAGGKGQMKAKENFASQTLGGMAAMEKISVLSRTELAIEQKLTVERSRQAAAYQELSRAAEEFAKTQKSSMTLEQKQAQSKILDESTANIARLEAQKKAIDKAKGRPEQIRELEISTARDLAAARGLELGAISEIVTKAAARLEQLREEQKLSSQIVANVRETAALQVVAAAQKLAKKDRNEILDNADENFKVRGKFAAEYYKETVRLDQDYQKERDQSEERGLSRTREIALRSLQLVHNNSLSAKVQLEEQKYQVEVEYARKSEALQMSKIWREYAEMRRVAFQDFQKTGNAGALNDRLDSIVSIRKQREDAIKETSIDTIGKARTDASVRQSEIITDAWQRQFNNLKRGFEGLFDAALAGGKTFADSLKRILLNALLTPVKEAFSNFAARAFLPMFGGRVNSGGMSGAPSTTSVLGSIFGGFGGFGTGTRYPATTPPFWGGGSSSGGYTNIPGMVGVGIGSSGQVIYNQQGGSGVGGWAGMLAGGKGMLTSLGNLGSNFSSAHGGVNGAAGGAMLLGGGILGFDGLRRGGLVGMAETTAGGALIGAKFGGPLGAVIGAGVGALAGFIRLFVKGAEQKTIDKVRDRYGVKIDRPFAKTLLESSKQYGGIDVYLGTAQAREAIWLYAQMTDQKKSMGMTDNQARGVFLEQRGGSLMQGAVYSGGTAYGYQSSLPSIGSLTPIPPAASAGGSTIVLNENGTKEFLTNLFVGGIVNNPTAVANANNAATAQSVGRLVAAGQLVDPLGGRL